MKVVILAAGFGSRFGDHDLPKPLTLLKTGQSILGLQVNYLKKVFSPRDIFIVVGFQKEKIINKFSDLTYIHSPNFARENTAKSLLKAVSKIDDDLLWLNGDVVFHPSVLETILATDKTSMVVNRGTVADEEVKYLANAQGQILEVSKEVNDPQGEALGINLFTRKDLPILHEKLAICEANDYFEKAIEMCIEDGMAVWSVPIPQDRCIEIDFAEDLEKANDLLGTWET